MKSKNIWIIGASYGIGKALAFELAKQGHNVAISARSVEQLQQIYKELPIRKNNHLVLEMDVCESLQIEKAIEKIQHEWQFLDSVIFMAAIYEPSSILDMKQENIEKTISINLTSVFYLTQKVLPIFLDQKKGQIAICSSVASYRGLANSQPYAATKAAISNFAESLNSEYGKLLDIKLINPGFVDTRLTSKNSFYMPFQLTPTKAAKIISKNLNKKLFEIHFPKRFTLFLKLLKVLPDFLYFKVSQKLK